MSTEERKSKILKDEEISVLRQCNLLGLCRSSLYYTPATESEENLRIMNMLDRQYAKAPFYGGKAVAQLAAR